MKKLVTLLVLTIGVFTNAQTDALSVSIEEQELNNVTMEVTVDSAEDLKETFKVKDMKELLEMCEGKSAKFKLTCRGERMSNGVHSSMSYAVEKGDLSEEDFLKMVKKIRKAAIKYYNNI
jgi:hypothetical protein